MIFSFAQCLWNRKSNILDFSKDLDSILLNKLSNSRINTYIHYAG